MSAPLNHLPRKRLCQIVAEYGVSITDDERRCRNILNDKCGQYGREIKRLMAAMPERVPADLLSDAGTMPELMLNKLAQRLQINLGMATEDALWVVTSWAMAVGKIQTPIRLDQMLEHVKCVGPDRAAMLRSKGLETVDDLLAYVPSRYEDRSNMKTLAELAPGELAPVVAEVLSVKPVGVRQRAPELFEARFTDASRAILECTWPYESYLTNVLTSGRKVVLYGKVEFNNASGEICMLHPEFEILAGDEPGHGSLHVGRVVPIYAAVGELTTRVLRGIMDDILKLLEMEEDSLPEPLRHFLKFPTRLEALRATHFPPPNIPLQILNCFRSPAQFRLIFEEFFWIEYGMELKRTEVHNRPGIAFSSERVRERVMAMLAMLPFKPTNSQKRVFKEIAEDMFSWHRMNRLVHGDSGSGKTLVAVEAALIAIENGYQVAILAPAESLATGHFRWLQPMFARLGYVTVLLTESGSAEEHARTKELISRGGANMVVGTLALLDKDVEFDRLGLVVIDELHRFEVTQRFEVQTKGAKPDVLMLSATPPPRYLIASGYGFLDSSFIDELPPGRQPIITRDAPLDGIEEAYGFLRQQVNAGHQAYVVCPTVEGADTKSLDRLYAHLSTEVFPSIAVGLMHERLGSEENESVLENFRQGRTRVLVATEVIEVCTHVTDATAILLVLNSAERMGLVKLHQLRGLVGRGPHQSYCILISRGFTDEDRDLIQTLVETPDGFKIANHAMRSCDGIFPELRYANIHRDHDILQHAKHEARCFTEHPPSEDELRRALAYIPERFHKWCSMIQS